jgi:hypothetical protein
MSRPKTIRTVLLISAGVIAGLSLSTLAADDGPAIPAPADQTPAKQPAATNSAPPQPAAKTPATRTSATQAPAAKSTPVPSTPAKPVAPGTVIAPSDADPLTIPPAPPARTSDFPLLRQMMRPDGSFDLPGGVGNIKPGDDSVGIQINTPDGPLQFNVPRRQRAASGADEGPGPDGEAGPGRRAGVNSRRASREFTIASRIFTARNYPLTLRRLNRFLDRDAGDRDLVQLRSLTNFALGDYRAAYRDALTAVTDGDVWDWANVRSLYRSAGEYTAQYRALEDYIAAHANSSEAVFLFAYHNQMLGNHEAARREFARAASIDPNNEAARRLAAGEGPPQPLRQTPTPSAPGAKAAPPVNVPVAPPQGTTSGPAVDLGQPAPLK